MHNADLFAEVQASVASKADSSNAANYIKILASVFFRYFSVHFDMDSLKLHFEGSRFRKQSPVSPRRGDTGRTQKYMNSQTFT
jgi:hypothetical protein